MPPGSVCNISVSLSRVPKDFFTNYVFDGWIENNHVDSRSVNYSFIVTQPMSLKASWRTETNLTIVATMAIVILILLTIVIATLLITGKHFSKNL
ncbi:MAG: hypothetical protein FGF48_09635 [Candidatus Brockarchaeota archaeon]|nr:hypothetical protein [Candidatus Brockarchaeota archaeon]